MNRPNLFIIGAPKCGTTSVASWLSRHPNVYISKVKEPHYYAFDLYKHVRAGGYDRYLSLFSDAESRHKLIGEASTGYLFSRVAVDRILSDNPEAKIVVCLRNPVSMAVSLHRQRVNDGLEDVEGFLQAWSMQDERIAGTQGFPFACPNPYLLHYGHFCSLGAQVERLLKAVPRDQVHFVLLDDLKESAESEFAKLLKFLGLEWHDVGGYQAENEAFVRKNLWLHRSLARIYRVRRMLRIPRLGTGLMSLESRLNRQPVPREKINHVVNDELRHYFHDDVKNLEKLLGRDLSKWLIS